MYGYICRVCPDGEIYDEDTQQCVPAKCDWQIIVVNGRYDGHKYNHLRHENIHLSDEYNHLSH